MKKETTWYRFSPTDLVNFVRSEFVTWMDRYHYERPERDRAGPRHRRAEDHLRQGLEHERAFLDSTAAQGGRLCDLREFRDQPGPTLDAMRRGEDVIYQG